MNRKQKLALARIIAASAAVIALELTDTGNAAFALFLAAYLTAGYDVLLRAAKGVLSRRLLDENFLMAVATAGAVALGEYAEGAAVMIFYQMGELFESFAVGRSRKSISALMDIRPDYANIEREGRIERADPDDVPVGSVIVVQPGERVPIDGVVVEGSSSLNTSALTGESLPRHASAGDEVISGCICESGVLRLRTTKLFGESTVSRVLDLVENAGLRKSKSENFITKFARIYTPAVCAAAAALALLPPAVRLSVGLAPEWGEWIYRALILLVISCPCALVISIPLSFFAGIGGASREGVLIKGSNYLETLSKTKCAVFDKTGTLTEGSFEVTDVFSAAMPGEKLLEYAAFAESFSTHPISKSLIRAFGGEPDKSRVSNVREAGGRGVTADVDGVPVAVGSAGLMRDIGVKYGESGVAGTVAHVAVGGAYAGCIMISDRLKPNSAAAVRALKDSGVARIVMLTGDVRDSAESAAARLGISEVYGELLPGDKVAKVEELLAETRGGKLAFVGDGINDAPVLARADVGIAMGALGSDAAIEAADVVLMDDDPLKAAKAIRIAKKCIGIVRQNIWFAIGVKALCLILGALGLANMWLAIFADVGVMVIAVLNAIRALFVKDL